jgi:hypothetical protein
LRIDPVSVVGWNVVGVRGRPAAMTMHARSGLKARTAMRLRLPLGRKTAAPTGFSESFGAATDDVAGAIYAGHERRTWYPL